MPVKKDLMLLKKYLSVIFPQPLKKEEKERLRELFNDEVDEDITKVIVENYIHILDDFNLKRHCLKQHWWMVHESITAIYKCDFPSELRVRIYAIYLYSITEEDTYDDSYDEYVVFLVLSYFLKTRQKEALIAFFNYLLLLTTTTKDNINPENYIAIKILASMIGSEELLDDFPTPSEKIQSLEDNLFYPFFDSSYEYSSSWTSLINELVSDDVVSPETADLIKKYISYV